MRVVVMEYLGKKCVANGCNVDAEALNAEVLDWAKEIMREEDSFEIKIYTQEMTQEEVDSLPEFEGY